MLEKELAKNPERPFTLFNLGSEYYAMGDNLTAIQYFEKAYEKFDSKEGFSSYLILKMAHCYSALLRYDDAMHISQEGLINYPEFTDLEYFMGTVEQARGNYILALRHYSKCREMGEAPNHLNVIVGAGTYRPYLMIANIFYDMEDYDSAVQSCKNALNLYPKCIGALILLIKTYCQMDLDENALKENIEDHRKYHILEYDSMVFEILTNEKYYDLALVYIDKFERSKGKSVYSQYFKAVVMFFMRDNEELLQITNSLLKDPAYKVRAACLQALFHITQGDYTKANELVNQFKVSDSQINMMRVYRSLGELFLNGKAKLLSDDEADSAKFTPVIFDILKMMLQTKDFASFEKALELLNTVSDKTVLCMLAKLYYREKCFRLAYQELIRSIKIFDYLDTEGAKILYKLKLKGFK